MSPTDHGTIMCGTVKADAGEASGTVEVNFSRLFGEVTVPWGIKDGGVLLFAGSRANVDRLVFHHYEAIAAHINAALALPLYPKVAPDA